MPRNSDLAKTYCTLREAFDLVGTEAYGPKWRGFEADCDPAWEKQQTDARSLLRKLAPDGRSFTEERLPVPRRPIDDKDGATLKQAIERNVEATKELLRLLHDGHLRAEFIGDDETTVRDSVSRSVWPDPAEFEPKEPSWRKLWFDIAADRVVLKSPGTSPIPGRAQSEGSMWWAYGGRAGHVEIDREALVKLLRTPKDKGDGRKRDPLDDAALKNQYEMVLVRARKLWPDKKKRPTQYAMAMELTSTRHADLGYKFSTIKKILAGIYRPAKRLGISGL